MCNGNCNRHSLPKPSPGVDPLTVMLLCVMLFLGGMMFGLSSAPVPSLEAYDCDGVLGDYKERTYLYADEEDHFPSCGVIQQNRWWR